MNSSSDIYTQLKNDHTAAASILQRLAQTTTGDTAKRRSLFAELKHSLTQHSEAEEQVFYWELRQHNATRALIRDSQKEHEHIDELLDELERMGPESPQWPSRLQALQETIEHHVQQEEGQLFTQARGILTPQQAEAMGHRLTQAKARRATSQAKKTAQRNAPASTANAPEAGSQVYQEARRLADEAKQQGESIVRQQQGFVATQIESIAGALHKTAEQLDHDEERTLAQYTEQAAAGLERFSHSIRDQDFNSMVRQVQDFARQQPTVFIGSAVLLGFVAARFLKSSAERSPSPQPHASYAEQAGEQTAAASSDYRQPSTTPSPVPDPTLEVSGGGARRTTTIPGGE